MARQPRRTDRDTPTSTGLSAHRRRAYNHVLSEDATMLRTLAIAAAASVSTGAVAGEPLFDAVSAGDTAGIERLLSTGAPIDGRDRDCATPLIIAALNAQPGPPRCCSPRAPT